MMASGVRKPPRQAEQMPANGQPANDQLKSLAKGPPSTDAREADPASVLLRPHINHPALISSTHLILLSVDNREAKEAH